MIGTMLLVLWLGLSYSLYKLATAILERMHEEQESKEAGKDNDPKGKDKEQTNINQEKKQWKK
jgi:hypothetical protein